MDGQEILLELVKKWRDRHREELDEAYQQIKEGCENYAQFKRKLRKEIHSLRYLPQEDEVLVEAIKSSMDCRYYQEIEAFEIKNRKEN
ncbi:hypothetical protein LJC51_07515 [Lachnospiraceae bacterium OttesenSCG-928-J05]|nr:hypothetical protein [Lachnospiraceae bacterium OttesenSCG-928-J05]